MRWVDTLPSPDERDAEARAQSIEGMLRNQPGIHSVKVALLAERAVVEYDPEKWTVDKIAEVCATICQPARPFPD